VISDCQGLFFIFTMDSSMKKRQEILDTILSSETRSLMKQFMQESRLTLMQRRGVFNHLRSSPSLPPPPRRRSASVDNSYKGRTKGRKKFQKIRTRAMIEQSGAYERDMNLPPTGRCITDSDKDDLVHWMAYRQQRPPSPSPQELLGRWRDGGGEKVMEEGDRFSELVEEIEERKEFLVEMTRLGAVRDKKLQREVEGEIALKLREMRILKKEKEREFSKIDKMV